MLLEVVRTALELVADVVGLNGLAIGSLALAIVGLYYLREAAALLVVVSRYARMLSVILGVLLVALVAGTHFGIVDLSSGGSLIGRLLGLVEGLL